MTYYEDAFHLISHSHYKLQNIKDLHEKSLQEKTSKSLLVIEIKEFLENMRSALDYAAHGLVEKYGEMPTDHRDVQFPYTRPNQNKESFVRSLDKRIPGVVANCPKAVEVLASYQHFSNRFGDMISWLPLFMELTNENKHRRLTPQKLKIIKLMTFHYQIPAGSVDYPISFPPNPEEASHVEEVSEPTLVFIPANVPVLMFLKSVLANTERIVTELSKL